MSQAKRTTRTCPRVSCMAEFTPTHGNQRYCTPKCCRLQNSRNQYHKDPKKAQQRSDAWAKNNPEKAKNAIYKAARKTYINGKLPKWMYS